MSESSEERKKVSLTLPHPPPPRPPPLPHQIKRGTIIGHFFGGGGWGGVNHVKPTQARTNPTPINIKREKPDPTQSPTKEHQQRL